MIKSSVRESSLMIGKLVVDRSLGSRRLNWWSLAVTVVHLLLLLLLQGLLLFTGKQILLLPTHVVLLCTRSHIAGLGGFHLLGCPYWSFGVIAHIHEDGLAIGGIIVHIFLVKHPHGSLWLFWCLDVLNWSCTAFPLVVQKHAYAATEDDYYRDHNWEYRFFFYLTSILA